MRPRVKIANRNPWHDKMIDTPYISLDNKIESQFLLLSFNESQSIGSKQVIDKTIAAQVHGSNFEIFNFLENDDFFWNSVESLDFFNNVT